MHFFFPNDARKGKGFIAHSFLGCIPHYSVEKCIVSSGFISNRQGLLAELLLLITKFCQTGGGVVVLCWLGWVSVFSCWAVVCIGFLNKQLGRYHLAFPSPTNLAFYKEMTIRLIEHNFSFINWCQLLPITTFSIVSFENSSETIFSPSSSQ